MKTYRALSRLPWPGSYVGKLFLACFVGTHIPLAGFIAYVVLRPGTLWTDVAMQFGVLLAATLAGTALTLGMLQALLAPVTQACRALVAYTERGALPDLPTGHVDEAGVLMAQVQATIEHLHAVLGDLSAQALTDPLTGAGNRRWLGVTGAQRLLEVARTREPVAVVVLDLDHFKRVNDGHGHAAGDAVLRAAADAVRREVRPADLFARIGGEEFCLVLPGTGREAGRMIAERLRQAFEELRIAVWPELRVTASLGLSAVRGGETTLAPAIARADEALYEAKRRGRNMVVADAGQPEPELQAELAG